MDKETKKRVNNAIVVLKQFCKEQEGCHNCPLRLNTICNGTLYGMFVPGGWSCI